MMSAMRALVGGRQTNPYALLPQTTHDDSTSWTSAEKRHRRGACLRSVSGWIWKKLKLLRKCVAWLLLGLVLLISFTALFNTSYLAPAALHVPDNQKVFIAANILDADLIYGPWGKQLLDLVQRLGTDRTFVSIYGGPAPALHYLDERLKALNVPRSLVAESSDPIDLDQIDYAETPIGRRPGRIPFLAEIRNRVLRPLHHENATVFDKILFINDIIYKPEDALRLLYGTNVREDTGEADYKAACAMDFVNPFKYYDTYATRDFEGRSLGVPFFPWFSNNGEAISRRDVLAGKDAVRVRSCWGGMVAFDAQYFQPRADSPPATTDETRVAAQEPLLFRDIPESGWEGSECCIIHADLQSSRYTHTNMSIPDLAAAARHDDSIATGIYINPFVRVAYAEEVFKWLKLVQRVERLFTLGHSIASKASNTPGFQPRRLELEGQTIHEEVWVWDQPDHGWNFDELTTSAPDNSTGYFAWRDRIADNAGFCSSRNVLVLQPQPSPEPKAWERIIWPTPPSAATS